MRQIVIVFLVLNLAGCAQLGTANLTERGGAGETDALAPYNADDLRRPKSRPATLNAAPPPSATARTPEALDTTSQEARAAAAKAPTASSERALGLTVATLGDPTDPGFWLKTPLVQQEQAGRVAYKGNFAALTLRPINGPSTAGSQLSLPAMRLIGAPLTGLLEIQVFAGGS
ncbi:MAG: hypothetical protein MK098_08455 [Marinovum sp.]|nr:hypothetical protein [Marinovum sp.]